MYEAQECHVKQYKRDTKLEIESLSNQTIFVVLRNTMFF